MRVTDRRELFLAGLRRIRSQFHVPDGFPAAVLAAADDAAGKGVGSDHVDRTDVEFVTLDPEEATDLDQAFAISRDGDDIVLQYAIADVGHFVAPGGPLDEEAWKRGLTVYLPDEKAPLYPPGLSERAASLLPDGPKPAVNFIVRVAEDGAVRLAGAERAVIRSRAKLAYDDARVAQLPPAFDELAVRIVRAERARDAPRVEFPDQAIERGADGRLQLVFHQRLESEDRNAAMSLATNLAVADALLEAKTGLFRVMAEPTERAVARLRYSARAFGLVWPPELSLLEFQRTLPAGDPRTAAFLIAVRRAGGGASYQPYVDGSKPWHAAMAATYTHATAPLRRLADRYVIEAALAVANGRAVPGHVAEAFEQLPKAMERGETKSRQVDAAVLDLAEAVVLAPRVGEFFDGVIVDEDRRGAMVQLTDPAVLARITARRVDPGDDVRVQLVDVDLEQRVVVLRRVA
jgi:exoribonuclease R